jgi:beta-galactosidase
MSGAVMPLRFSFLAAALLMLLTVSARERKNFDADWRFILADSATMAQPSYDDSHWRMLSVPHDWAREGDFSAANPSGAGGGALPGGVGWYRKHFYVGNEQLVMSNDARAQFFIEFDGVYMNSTVYVNGTEVGHRPYGYSSFEYDITPLLRKGDNVVAVRVDNSDQPNSRWYSGCGIYRHVWLTRTHPVHVKHWGVHAESSLQLPNGYVRVEVEIENPTSQKAKVEHHLIDQKGRVVARSQGGQSKMAVRHPSTWSCDNPYVYTLRTLVKVGGEVVDQVDTPTGFRSFSFDPQRGFSLNGKNFKINGVCEHHDFGCLGAALSEDALHRKLTKLKQMGVNAIRSSHNPPAPELLAMCDTMGLIVMDESFDMWRRRKTQNDYARFFDEWHERDLTDLVLRDRNHPCILMWSIGNEVLEQWSSAEADTLTLEQANLILNAGHDATTLAKEGETSVQSLLTKHLADIVHRHDATRPITAGCNEPSPDNHLFRSEAIDIIGFNYHHQWVKDVPKNFPGKPFLFSESVSALQTRGYYMMPSDTVYKAPVEWWLPYADPSFMCSAYDNMHASWSSTHEELWDVVKHTPFCGGQFIWTGFDYIGEPTPYGFPARSSYFGLIDLAGFPKDTYYMYQSEWTTEPMLHLFPHWNWLPGQTIDLWCYYNQADEVELYINGRSQGVRRKKSHDANGWKPALTTEYHAGWRVAYEPGELKAVSRKNGQVVCQQTIRTASAPAAIRLSIDYAGNYLTFVNAEVVDVNGTLCPWADDQLFFSTEGSGTAIVATDNGCQTSMERFTAPQRKAFHGKCIAVVQGHGTLTAKGYGLDAASIVF